MWLCCCGSPYNVEKFSDTTLGTTPTSLWRYQAGPDGTTTEGIRVISDGTSFVAYKNGNANEYDIDIIDTDGVKVRTVTVKKRVRFSTDVFPHDWDVDNSGNIYTFNGDVYKYNVNGVLQWQTSPTDVLDYQAGRSLACDKTETNGVLFTTTVPGASQPKDNLVYLDTSGSIQFEIEVDQSTASTAVDLSGNLYVGGSGTADLEEYDTSGNNNWTSTIGPNQNFGSPIPIDSSGNLGCVTGNRRVQRVNSSGTVISNFQDLSIVGSVDIQFAGDDEIIYTNLTAGDYRIRQTDSTGTESWAIADGWRWIGTNGGNNVWGSGATKTP